MPELMVLTAPSDRKAPSAVTYCRNVPPGTPCTKLRVAEGYEEAIALVC